MLVYSSFMSFLPQFFEQFRGKGIFALAQRVNPFVLMCDSSGATPKNTASALPASVVAAQSDSHSQSTPAW
jgi:hypothetical protein